MSYRSLRVGGLASGIDVDMIVKQLMSAHKIKKQKLEQQKTLLEWKQEDYRNINNQLRKLRDATSALRLQGTFLTNTAVSSDESKVAVTASGTAVGTYEITVERLATPARLLGAKIGDVNNQPLDINKPLEELFGDEIVDSGTGLVTFEINGEKLSFSKSDSLAAVFHAINRNEKAGVVMFYDEHAGQVVVTAKETGKASGEILQEIMNSDNAFFKALGLVDDGSSPELTFVEGENAVVTINGLKTERSSNTFTINGITFTLKDTTSAPVTVGVKRDVDSIVEKIKAWVEAYNSTLDAINAKLKEQRYRDYLPLTEEQMEELTDKQIDKWEEKARSGLLKHDAVLRNELYALRTAVYSFVEGLDKDFNHLNSIGISVGTSSFDSEGKLLKGDDYLSGKLHINEEVLRNALETNPDKVMDLFTAKSEEPSRQGIGVRMYRLVGESIDRIADIAGYDGDLVDNSNIGSRLRDLNERIAREEQRLQRLEDQYWKQFSAMEQAINRMNQQSAWLMLHFGGNQQ